MKARLLVASLAFGGLLATDAVAQTTIPDHYLGRYAFDSCHDPDQWVVFEANRIRLFDNAGREESEDVRVLSVTQTSDSVSLEVMVDDMRGTLEMRWVSNNRLEVSFVDEDTGNAETELLQSCPGPVPGGDSASVDAYMFDDSVAAFVTLVVDLGSICEPGAEAACLDRFWSFADVTGDGALTIAELARVGRHAAKWAAAGQAQFMGEGERIVIHLGTLLTGPLVARLLIDNYDYDDDGALVREELFPEGVSGAPLTVDAILALFDEAVLEDIGDALEDLDMRF